MINTTVMLSLPFKGTISSVQTKREVDELSAKEEEIENVEGVDEHHHHLIKVEFKESKKSDRVHTFVQRMKADLDHLLLWNDDYLLLDLFSHVNATVFLWSSQC